ncbi:TPA: hypothetical protein PXO89_002748 [Yersinia enterocolitica]|nr:hypothetical protein [Yersinia enterocolitica]
MKIGNFQLQHNSKSPRKKRGIAINESQREEADKKKTKFILYAILILTALTYYEVSNSANKEKIVIAPFASVDSGDFWVTGVSASESYVNRMAKLVTAYYGTVSPTTVKNSNASLLAMVHPTRSEVMRKKFNEREKKVTQFTTVSFITELNPEKPIQVTTNPDVDYKEHGSMTVFRMEVPVTKRKIIGETSTNPETAKYTVDYTIESNQFWLLDITGL